MKITRATLKRGMPDSEYFQLTDHIGSSEINDYIQSPYGHKLRYIDKHPAAQFNGNRSTDIGTMFDDFICAYIGPSARPVHVSEFCGTPYPDKWLTASGRLSQTKEVKAAVAEAEAAGEVFETPEKIAKDAELLRVMVDSFLGNQVIDAALQKVTATQLVIQSETAGGLKLRGKMDLETSSGGYDLKTGRVHPDDFITHAVRYGYHYQKVFYMDQYDQATGSIGSNYAFLYQMNCYPFESALIELPFDLEKLGRIKVYQAIAGLERQDHQHKHINTFTPDAPAWTLYELDGV